MEKFKYAYRPQFVEFMKGLFDLATFNKEADCFEVLHNGLPLVYPTNDSSAFASVPRFFDSEHTSTIQVRFFLRHKTVREYTFENDGMVQHCPEGDVLPAQSDNTESPDGSETRTISEAKNLATLMDQVAESFGGLIDAAITTAELADVRGELLNSYEERIARQQATLDRYRQFFGELPDGEPGVIETFGNEHFFGVRFNKAKVKKSIMDVLSFVQMLNGSAFPGKEKKKKYRFKRKVKFAAQANPSK